MKRLVFSSICLLVFVCAANADVIFNNLGSITTGNDGVAFGGVTSPDRLFGPLAASFSVHQCAPPCQLTMVGVKLLASSPTDGGGISVELWTDNPPMGGPGSSLFSLGTLTDAQLSTGFGVFSFPAADPLTANTRYWIRISDLDPTSLPTSVRWAWSGDQTALGVHGEFFFNRNVVWSDTLAPYQMEVEVAGASPPPIIPEPSTFLLLGSGLLGLIGLVRRRLLT